MLAIIFDVDGVVGDTESVNERASIAVFRDMYNVETQAEDFREFIGMGDEKYLSGVADKYDVTIDVPKATQQREENICRILETDGLDAYPGVLELMQAAHADARVKLAIATSGRNPKAGTILQAAGVDLEWFDTIVTGNDVTHKKPHPEIYTTTIGRLNVPAEKCVVFEDAPAGVEAARTAGAYCIGITNTVGADKLSQADRVVESVAEVSLDELKALLVS